MSYLTKKCSSCSSRYLTRADIRGCGSIDMLAYDKGHCHQAEGSHASCLSYLFVKNNVFSYLTYKRWILNKDKHV